MKAVVQYSAQSTSDLRTSLRAGFRLLAAHELGMNGLSCGAYLRTVECCDPLLIAPSGASRDGSAVVWQCLIARLLVPGCNCNAQTPLRVRVYSSATTLTTASDALTRA